jgi:predicted flap endonuclease-1-like 5' DNA nuclease
VAWFLGYSFLYLLLAFALGLLVGWLIWGRQLPGGDTRGRHKVVPEPVKAVEQAVAASLAAGVAPKGSATVAEPEPVAEPAVAAEPEHEAESVLDTVPEAELAVAPERESEPEREAEPVLDTVPEVEPETETAAEPESEGAVDSEPEIEPVGQPMQLFAAPAVPAAEAIDDLQRIEGIGPKISGVLAEAGVHTYLALAALDKLRLTEILTAGGVKFAPSLTTWSEQAQLLADGNEEAFAELTSQLTAGRRSR